jgi:hypothetical protein
MPQAHQIGQQWINGLFERVSRLTLEIEQRRYATGRLHPKEMMVYDAADDLIRYIHSIKDMKTED